MVRLTEKWTEYLKTQPETGMSYQVATVRLRDGRVFEKILIVGDLIAEIDHSPHSA